MLTLFAAPKPFAGHIGLIQRNAVRSWTLLPGGCEVILLGDEPGIAEVAAEFGVRHIPDVRRNEFGTPLISDIFARAAEAASFDTLCYVNADIILTSSLVDYVDKIRSTGMSPLMVGRRWDIWLTQALDFSDGWEGRLAKRCKTEGFLHPASGIDYFVFRRGLFRDALPTFAVGRVRWDNWMIYAARILDIPVIDLTDMVFACHQDHDYAHIRTQKEGEDIFESQAEQRYNKLLAFEAAFSYTIDDASYVAAPTELIGAQRAGRRPMTPIKYRHPFGFNWLPVPDLPSTQINSGTYRQEAAAFLRRILRPGMNVVIAGAHHGFLAMTAAAAVGPEGRVSAFEPSAREYSRLSLHALANNFDNLRPAPLALADTTGSRLLRVDPGVHTDSGVLDPADTPAESFAVPVEAVTLDDWLTTDGGGGVDVLVIDVGGKETAPLDGAAALLARRPRPVVLCRGSENAPAIADRLAALGYRCGRLNAAGEMSDDGDVGVGPAPFAAVPIERIAEDKRLPPE